MSWTLVRRQNGQEVPIKVSVLDVFRSGSKKEKLAQSSFIVRPKANSKAPVAPKAEANTDTTAHTRSTSEPEVWTVEDDEILRRMKTGPGKSWKEILEALGDKHVSGTHAKARWKEIEGRVVSATGAEGDRDEESKIEEAKKVKGEQKKAEGLAKQAAAREAKERTSEEKEKKSSSKSNNKESAISREHELKAVAAKYDKDKWLAVASRHFDKTGQRISPEMAKTMCLSMS